MQQYKYTSILTIAGSDSGGGAGIQADLKTFSALGCYGTSAITAVTVQNTRGVSAIHPIPATIVTGQINAVMDDIVPAAVKIGMLPNAELALAVSHILLPYQKNIPIIFDPVMIAGSGQQLMENETIAVLKQKLFPITALLTPNLDEASFLIQQEIRNVKEMLYAAKLILGMGPEAVLIKGGHLKGEKLYDVYVNRNGTERIFESQLIKSYNLHGTGCTLSSAIAAFISLAYELEEAIVLARTFVYKAIWNGKDVQTGLGQGPLNHFFNPLPLQKFPN